MTTYRDVGVDIEAAARAKQLMAGAVHSTYSPAVLAGIGAFGGCFDLRTALGEALGDAVLVASTDSVGTKTLVAAALGRYETLGYDLVNHCVNDILVQGARPLFLLDYLAVDRLNPQRAATLVASVATACRAAGCVLLGGETAQMPDVYRDGAFELAGTIVGVVQRERMLPQNVAIGDVILALPSSGLHTNGYSLARRALGPDSAFGYDATPAELGGRSVGEALLEPHRSYLSAFEQLAAAEIPVHALAHITGGGVYENLPRVLPEGYGAVIRRGTWDVPPICALVVHAAGLDEHEAYRTLNMGLGMLVIVPSEAADAALRTIHEARLVGEVIAGEGVHLIA
ncbi:phosphoribosylformylglycinamidine cyclo-ligase [Roseiflexus sp.]|uniref:phosphoribosylformylglycinamidine cyclo-ligase n=1 Tax=Roseiflexus sp. TaxID=2562120 RepID=UPI0021DF37C3|nr:phosphoribosylformylglycinamidine cyclo-ligase [Roseiflexus sp.]GIW00836.1 MAG: phosphoribosylformylglycinamidine cyclo-ligase [Roseiflexus sp.]